jgi:hypothetical protein
LPALRSEEQQDPCQHDREDTQQSRLALAIRRPPALAMLRFSR